MLSNVLFRNAVDADLDQLSELFKQNFGEMAEYKGALDFIVNRYIVAELYADLNNDFVNKDKKIIAVSGIVPPEKSIFDGYEISWTCTNPNYRKQGLITTILNICEKQLPNDGIPLYCDCWRIGNNSDINLVSVMKYLGMHEVVRSREFYKYPFCKSCNYCLYAKDGCFCYVDLYMKER